MPSFAWGVNRRGAIGAFVFFVLMVHFCKKVSTKQNTMDVESSAKLSSVFIN
jgi:hypothetical protein